MLTDEGLRKVRDLAGEVSAREGCYLYDIEFVGQKGHRTLRVYIDAEENGVSIDQCAEVSRGLSWLLDVEDVISGGQYDLEVSSPGLERPLRTKWHFERAMGQLVKVQAKEPLVKPASVQEKENRQGGRSNPVKQVTGQLVAVEEDFVKVENQEGEWTVPMELIHRARTVFQSEQFKSKNEGPKKGQRRKKGKK